MKKSVFLFVIFLIVSVSAEIVDTRTRLDLKGSMNLAGQNLLDCLNPSSEPIPYMPLRAINLSPQADGTILASYDGCLPRHDIGRWWDAMLRLEEATGFKIPPEIETVMLKNTKFLFDNSFHVMRRPWAEHEGFDHHSFRENLLALNALIRYRNNQWAREKSHAMIKSILDGTTPLPFPNHVLSGRFIEAVIWNYEITKNPDALILADKLARAHLNDVTNAEGSEVLKEGHMHSYLGTLRGLLLFGELTGQREYIDRVAITYQNNLKKRITKSGFMPHDIGGHLGETASPGDVAQIALWLGTRHGYSELLDDVERIVRARIIPSQVTGPTSPPLKAGRIEQGVIQLPSQKDVSAGIAVEDAFRDLNKRIVGGYGGCHPKPHAQKTVTEDVTAADIHTLVDIYNHIAVRSNAGIKVYFHFDYEDENIKITSIRTKTAQVTIEPKVKDNILIRIPRWVSKDSVQITVDDKQTELQQIGDFILVARELLSGKIVLTYNLPVSVETEHTAGVDYTFLWRGDEVMGIHPNDDILPFYPTYKLPEAKGVTLKVKPFDLDQVQLLDGPFKDAMERDIRWLLNMEPDRLLHHFRINAGLSSSAQPYGGWESTGHILRGSFIGHYMTACSLRVSGAGDKQFKDRLDYIVKELAKCQRALDGSGYLSAFPEQYFDEIEAGEPGRVGISRVSWYVVHKIMAGLYDAYVYCDNQQALEVLSRMAVWAKSRTDRLTEEHMQEMLDIEHGGMLELMFGLYEITKNPDHLILAKRFEHRRIFDPLAVGDDNILIHLHGNSTVPKIHGAAKAYELLGENRYCDIVEFFWDSIVNKRSYVTGSSTDHEHWYKPNELATQLSETTGESCVPYNMLKLTRRLFSWQPDVKYADYYERALFNHILGAQHPHDGAMMWYVPLASGFWKSFPSDLFLCCAGTLSESYVKLNDSIYFHNDNGIYVNLFIASQLHWPEKGLRLRQETSFPEQEGTKLVLSLDKPVNLALHIRRPYWAQSGVAVKINNKPQKLMIENEYIIFNRIWNDGDVVEIDMPMTLHTHPMPDDDTLVAMMYGPVVLAGQLGVKDMTEEMIRGSVQPKPGESIEAPSFAALSKDLNAWIKPVPGQPLTFRTVGQRQDVTLIPFYKLFGQRYAVYWRISHQNSK